MSNRLVHGLALFVAASILCTIVCFTGVATAQNTPEEPIKVFLPRIDNPLVGESIEIPNGLPIYAFLVSGYSQNGQFNMFHFYKFAKCVLKRKGYVHYSWWNNLLAPYMGRVLHDPSSEPGSYKNLDALGFVPLLDLVFPKAHPEEDDQFQHDLEGVIERIRDDNPNAVIALVGHSMGGDAVARFGANTSFNIDILAPIDPVGNRTCMQWDDPDSDYCETPGFLFQNTRFRATHEDLLWEPGRRTFGPNIKYLYHRWQQEFLPPFDYGCPPGGPNVVLCSPNPFAPETDYLFDFEPPVTRVYGVGQGSTNVQSMVLTSLFSGCEIDPRWWICPNWLGGFDGHGEIVGFRGVNIDPFSPNFLESYPVALKARGNWPSGADSAENRKILMEAWEDNYEYLEQEGYAPANPNLCKVSGDLCDILAIIMGENIQVSQPPVAYVNGPYGSECDGTTTTVSLDGSGSSDPEGGVLTYMWQTDCPGVSPDDPTITFDDPASATPTLTVDTSNGCAVECIVELIVTDDFGKEDYAATSVTIGDTVSPVISCSADTTIECDEPTDPNHTGFATVTDDCDSNPAVTFSDVTTSGSCPQEFTIERTWTATDYCGNTSSCLQTIEVVDTTPPVISSVSANPEILWPPNHKMRLIIVEAAVEDNCDPEPVCKIISVESNEPTNGKGDGSTAPDYEITGDFEVKLRAERAGGGSGREYTITVKCTDDCDNSATVNTTVNVPHDKGKKK